jgi:hypothetical protein
MCVCETLWLNQKEHLLSVFENKVVKKMFGPKSKEVAGGWELHNNELHTL